MSSDSLVLHLDSLVDRNPEVRGSLSWRIKWNLTVPCAMNLVRLGALVDTSPALDGKDEDPNKPLK